MGEEDRETGSGVVGFSYHSVISPMTISSCQVLEANWLDAWVSGFGLLRFEPSAAGEEHREL
jgi:hypothetical protein